MMIARMLDPARLLLFACATMVSAWACAEPVTVERESTLRAEPALGASTVATVRRGVRGESIGKSGIWVNIKTPEGTGWVFTFNLRYGERAAGSGDLTAAGRLVSARPSTGVVSTIGIRGLSEEDLQRAAFNAGEMRRLDAFAAPADVAQRRAEEAGLAATSIDYLEGQ
jgi:hypothetical protein